VVARSLHERNYDWHIPFIREQDRVIPCETSLSSIGIASPDKSASMGRPKSSNQTSDLARARVSMGSFEARRRRNAPHLRPEN
jgi:hypothetical protein